MFSLIFQTNHYLKKTSKIAAAISKLNNDKKNALMILIGLI